jgi:hypothetical protein
MSNFEQTKKTSKGAAMLEKLRKGVKNERLINFPGSDTPMLLVPLYCSQQDAALAFAYEHYKKLGIEVNAMNSLDFYAEINLQGLALALRDADDREKKLFDSADELRSLITHEERVALIEEYLALIAECNPRPESLSSEEYSEIESHIKKKDLSRLSGIASSKLACFLLSMDSQPTNSHFGKYTNTQSGETAQ